MPAPGKTTLLEVRTIARQRADMVNSRFVTDTEFNSYISLSAYELYDLLVAAYGNNYYVATALQFVTNGTDQMYPLPNGFDNHVTDDVPAPAFYKLLGVDLALAPSPDSFVTIRPFMIGDRNRYAVPNFQSFYGVTNLRYRLNDNNLWFTPIPSSGQTIQIWYVPRLTQLQFQCIGTIDETTTISDMDPDNVLQLRVGMIVSGFEFTPGTKITAVGTDSITISLPALTSTVGLAFYAFDDQTVIDGVSGWEEYIIVDAAIKALEKEESDVSVLMAQKQGLLARIQALAENRDAGAPAVVTDSQWSDYWWPTGNGTGGFY